MKIIKFRIEGKYAHFGNKKTNATIRTYHQIYKNRIRGILGAMAGYSGNIRSYMTGEPAEYLTKLKNIKVGVIPNVYAGIFPIQNEVRNNTTGHSSEENGGVQRYTKQYLLNPSWDIYLDISGCEEEVQKLIEQRLIDNESVYSISLGASECKADITNVEVIDCEVEENPLYINSLFNIKGVELDSDIETDEDLVYGKKPFLSTFTIPNDYNENIGYIDILDLGMTNTYISNIDMNNRLIIKDSSNIIELV